MTILTRNMHIALSLLLAVGIAAPLTFAADGPSPLKEGQHARSIKLKDGETIHFWQHLPAGSAKAKGKLPVMIFLHGAGERGPKDGSTLAVVKKHGPPMMAAKDKAFPYILISPQCPRGAWWNVKHLNELLDRVLHELPADPDRVYLTGLSMGGFGSWAWASQNPKRFAAVAPICGGGDPSKVCAMKDIPTWVFHGDKDTAVKIELSKVMVDALKKCNGNVKFTVYPGVGHNSWVRAYADPKLYQWFNAQNRN